MVAERLVEVGLPLLDRLHTAIDDPDHAARINEIRHDLFRYEAAVFPF